MKYPKQALRRAFIAAGSIVRTASAGVLFALPAQAATSITFNAGTLRIIGDAASNTFVVGNTPTGTVTLNGSPVLGGSVARASMSLVHVEGGAGNDIIRLDETNGKLPRGELIGGEGRDAFTGGSGADTIDGGNGIDRASGGRGDDTVHLGADSDEFTWNVGDGNDHVDGDAGVDTLIFRGNDEPFESVSFGHFGAVTSRFSITRSTDPFQPSVTVDGGGFEYVKANLAGGVDNVGVFGLAGTGVGVLRLDLGPRTDGSAGGGPFFQDASIFGTDGADGIRLFGTAASGVTVSGLATGVIVTGAKDVDIFGKGGNDITDASRLAAGSVAQVKEFGAASFGPSENNVLIGHLGSDLLRGGRGDDRLEGRGGADVLEGGGGNEVIIP